ncbi:MAG: hypothetical protein RL033_3263 [Pseudomonadota bacterium]|jgi:hypothetical protein
MPGDALRCELGGLRPNLRDLAANRQPAVQTRSCPGVLPEAASMEAFVAAGAPGKTYPDTRGKE